MNKKDFQYYFRPIGFIDDPYYFIGKAIKIRKQRKEFESRRSQIQDTIQRLRAEKSLDATPDEKKLYLEKQIFKLEKKRNKKFDEVYQQQLSPDDWIAEKSLKIESTSLSVGKFIKRALFIKSK
jgi:predicted nuclease with TOPRIM domain